jgi:hypothetical protein
MGSRLRWCRRSYFQGTKCEPQARGEQDLALSKNGAKTGAPDRFHAEVIEPHSRKMWRSNLTRLHVCEKMILQPATDAKEGKIVPVLQTQTQLAEQPQRRLGILPPADFPAQIEQSIGVIARDCARTAEQFVDDLKGTATMASRRCAIDNRTAAARKIRHQMNVVRA